MGSKCFYCNKKISIVDTVTFKCKCKNTYCEKHFFYKNHNCNYDYISEFKVINSSNNIVNFDNKNNLIKI